MTCPQCRQDNPPEARFRNGCGGRLVATCATCGQSNPAASRFCNSCGARLAADDAASQPRFASPGAYTPRRLADRILTSVS
jgi:tRNA(Ile2) C34 agmatinyltransferase TiaS